MFSLIAFVFCVDNDTFYLGFWFLLAFFLRFADIVALYDVLIRVIYICIFRVLGDLRWFLIYGRHCILLSRIFLDVCML